LTPQENTYATRVYNRRFWFQVTMIHALNIETEDNKPGIQHALLRRLRRLKWLAAYKKSIVCMALFGVVIATVNMAYTPKSSSIPLDLTSKKILIKKDMRVAYLSRHIGTTEDFKYMADHLGLTNVTYHQKDLPKLGIRREEYKNKALEPPYDTVCEDNDAVFVSDDLLVGWPLVMPQKICKNLFFIITNRFDYMASGDEKDIYHQDMERAVNRRTDPAKFIINNPFEYNYLLSRNVFPEDPPQLIRPFGFSDIEDQKIPMDDINRPCLIINRVSQDGDLMSKLVKEKSGVECKVLGTKYGGPKTLAKYKSIVVHLPYQVATMKMWENIAYGTLMAIPSPEFMTQLCEEHHCAQSNDVFETKRVIDPPEDWYKYVDFFLPEWERCFIQFGSWSQLSDILKNRDYLADVEYCENRMIEAREENLNSWAEVFYNITINLENSKKLEEAKQA